MKLFNKLPKKSYSTPLGDLLISNLHVFFKKDLINKSKTTIEIDNKTTLIEASFKIFEDHDSIWAFLHSNNKINPFTFLIENSNIFKKYNQTKINFTPEVSQAGGDYTTGTQLTMPAGSILVQYSAVTGASWSFSSVGNFDLNGPFALVEFSDSYQTKITVKENKNTTGSDIIYANQDDIDDYSFIVNGSTNYYQYNNVFTNKNTKKYNETTSKIFSIVNDNEIILPGSQSSGEGFATIQTSTISGNTASATIQQDKESKTKTVTVLTPQSLSSSLIPITTTNRNSL